MKAVEVESRVDSPGLVTVAYLMGMEGMEIKQRSDTHSREGSLEFASVTVA